MGEGRAGCKTERPQFGNIQKRSVCPILGVALDFSIFAKNYTAMLTTDRGLLKYLLLGIITFGIYPIVVMSIISSEINVVAQRYDGKHTMHYCLMAFIFSWLTLGIAPFVWFHRLSARIGDEQVRRGLPKTISAGSFWGWYVLGSFIVVGPFIYVYKLLHSMNDICANFNAKAC